MKRLFFVSIIVLSVTVVSDAAVAAQRGSSEHNFEIATELSQITYKEEGLMETDGALYGVVGAYTYRENFWMLRLEGKYAWGEWDYEGSTWAGTPSFVNDIDFYQVETRGIIGYDFSPSATAVVTTYIGIGYRYLNDHMEKRVLGGYQRESTYFYSPLGVDAAIRVNDAWSWGVLAEYDLFWKGRQVSHMGDVFPGLNIVANTQSKGYGLRGSLRLSYQGGRFGVAAEPYIRFWRINDSAVSPLIYKGLYVGDLVEPKNKSKEIGLKLSVIF
jgi:hypothetical protein